jgi:hypothetical protein
MNKIYPAVQMLVNTHPSMRDGHNSKNKFFSIQEEEVKISILIYFIFIELSHTNLYYINYEVKMLESKPH